jgi:hypothetical protein
MTFKNTIRYVYLKILRTNDAPHRIALGFALGVFSGIFPGVGPVFALVLAFLFRANKATAVLGAVSVNTWVTVIILVPAIKTGALVFGLKWENLKDSYYQLKNDFGWRDLLRDGGRDVLLPILTGFLLCAALIAVLAYVISYVVVKNYRRLKQERAFLFGHTRRPGPAPKGGGRSARLE